MEVYKTLPEGTRAELIDNILYMPPFPTTNHQTLSTDLVTDINSFVRKHGLGRTVSAPMDVYLDKSGNAVEPDIIVVLKNQLDIIRNNGHIHGVPAILIEILSKGNKRHDLIRKKDLYERFGVQEYHVVDPDTRLVLSFSLQGDSYEAPQETIGKLWSSLLQAEFSF